MGEQQTERPCKIESAQLINNIIVTGIPEQPFKTYEKTKQCIYDIISNAIKNSDTTQIETAMEEAMKLDISYCMQVEKAKLGANWPISVTFGRRDDKERVMGIKLKLPQ